MIPIDGVHCTYYHLLDCDYRRGLDWWLDLLHAVDTARDYILQFTITHTLLLMSTVTPSLPLLGSGFQRRTFPLLWVP
jgi:hypothetical protein